MRQLVRRLTCRPEDRQAARICVGLVGNPHPFGRKKNRVVLFSVAETPLSAVETPLAPLTEEPELLEEEMVSRFSEDDDPDLPPITGQVAAL